VQGRSMEPVYHLGDAVIVKTLEHPQVGDIIVFHIPKGDPAAGMLVVHRIHAVRPDGTFQTKGDNRRYPDPFKIAPTDIVGSPAWTLPHFGRMIGLASSPVVVGITFGLMSMFFFLPKALATRDEGDTDDGDAEDGDAEDDDTDGGDLDDTNPDGIPFAFGPDEDQSVSVSDADR